MKQATSKGSRKSTGSRSPQSISMQRVSSDHPGSGSSSSSSSSSSSKKSEKQLQLEQEREKLEKEKAEFEEWKKRFLH